LFVSQIAVAEDLSEQAGADRFPGMDRHGRDTTIGMPHKMMTAPDPPYGKASSTKSSNHLTSAQPR